MRKLPVLLLAAGIVASLSSCATAPFSASCDSTVTSGDASSVVTATGKLGDAPTVDVPTPIVTKKVERSELIVGTGHKVASGDVAVIKFTLLNGTTGKVEAKADYSKLGVLVTLGDSPTPAITKGLECTTVGSRVVIATNAADAGQDPSKSTDSYVFVVDVMKAFPGKSYGVPQIPQAGMPSVVTAPNGAPGISILKQAPPPKLTVNVLQEANGKKLSAGDTIIAKYTAIVWADSSVFDSTWKGGQAKILTLTASTTMTKGLVDGLVGQHVGSQVLVVIPPGDGYGSAGSTGVPPGSTLVYVVDILGFLG